MHEHLTKFNGTIQFTEAHKGNKLAWIAFASWYERRKDGSALCYAIEDYAPNAQLPKTAVSSMQDLLRTNMVAYAKAHGWPADGEPTTLVILHRYLSKQAGIPYTQPMTSEERFEYRMSWLTAIVNALKGAPNA